MVQEQRRSPRIGSAGLAATLDRVSDGIIAVDREWCCVYVNRQAAQMLARDAEGLVGRNLWSALPEAVDQPMHQAYLRAMADGIAVVFEEYYVPAGRWLEHHVQPSPEGLTVLLRDVTDRRRARERARESHARMAEAQEIGHFGNWQWKPGPNEVSWSEELYRIYGLAPEASLTFDGYLERVHEDDRERVARVMREALEHRRPFRFEERILRPDGEVRVLRSEGQVMTGLDGEVSRMVGVCYDITEQRRAEWALDRLARMHAAILDAAAEGIYGIDRRGITNFVNPAAARMLGYAPEELMDRPAHEVLQHTRPDGRPYPSAASPIHLTRTEGSVVHRDDEVFWRKDGTSFWVEYTATPIMERDQLVGAVISFSDTSERRRTEQDLTLCAERLAGLAAAEGSAAIAGAAAETVLTVGTANATGSAPGAHIVERAVELAREHLGMELAFLGEFHGDEQVLRVVQGDAESFGVGEGTAIPLEGTYCKQLVDGVLPSIVGDTRLDERVRDLEITAHAAVGSYIGVPITLSDGRIYGTLCCVSHTKRPALDERDVRFLQTFGGVIAEQLVREELDAARRRLESKATTATALLSALEIRDYYTGNHAQMVVELARAVAVELGLSEQETADIELTALLHDIGKVGIPDAVLQKKGRLDELEWTIMREHPAIGARMIAQMEALAHLAPAMRAEHERWDGGGYPDGLSGEEIPLASRITFVCDAYHAMTSDRPYRDAMSQRDARRELEANAGTQFDRGVVASLLQVLEP